MIYCWKRWFGVGCAVFVLAACTIQVVRGQYYRAHKPASYTDYYNAGLKDLQTPQRTPRYKLSPDNYFARPAPSSYDIMQRGEPSAYHQQYVRPTMPSTTSGALLGATPGLGTTSRTTTSRTTTSRTTTSRTTPARPKTTGTYMPSRRPTTNYYHHYYGGRSSLGLPP